MQFSEFPLDHRVQKALALNHFETSTEIQTRCIPSVLSGNDLLACSKTGSGKTLAFLAPALHILYQRKAFSKSDPRMLVVCPTRELAKQVFIELKKLITNTSHKSVLLVGGENFNDQVKQLKRNCTFVVGTPGRIADHIEDKSLFLNGLEILVLDEADRILDLGFSVQLEVINQSANHRKRQSLLFSATLDHDEVVRVADSILRNPDKVSLDDYTELHTDIEQRFIFADHVEHKEALLQHLLAELSPKEQAIVFTATRADTERLSALVASKEVNAIALHGDLLQQQRNTIMQAFIEKKHQCLITTDIASRGLDIGNVTTVINFDLPIKATEYVHRVGRTGRAGNKGDATSLIGPKDWNSFLAIKRMLKSLPEFQSIEGMEAEFKGFKERKHKPTKKKTESKEQSPWDKAKPKKKKFDGTAGKEVGHMMIKKKKRQPVTDEIDANDLDATDTNATEVEANDKSTGEE